MASRLTPVLGFTDTHRRLQNVVIDLEVSAGTPSPTVDPSVRTVLIGHSMGGIVAAETLLHIISDEPISPLKPAQNVNPSAAAHTNSTSTSTSLPLADSHRVDDDILSDGPHVFMFPYIQGILAFDTPYLGISPSLIAHGAESQYRSASSAYSAISDLAGAFGYGAATKSTSKQSPQPKAALPPAPEHAKDVLSASMTAASDDAAATPTWQRLGKYAMFAGAAGAVAAGGAAAYLKKDALSSGWSWVGSHLEFVGCLIRGEELKSRLDKLVTLNKERGIGFADLHTVLGKGATGGGGGAGRGAAGGEEKRTFCNIPKSKQNREYWWPEVNDKAKEETGAHMTMFMPRENPGYYGMGERAKGLVVGWVEGAAWASSEGMVGFDEDLAMDDVDIDGEGQMDFGVAKEEGVLWGDEQVVVEDNPWKMEGEKGLEGEESVIVERR
ncbi:MAG: hypothetical protein L6R41_004773 [Letrouitia leprolyta]|nr:MAG: hypothetical protein L6R41_004773 [Letrouitia leprolyta]